MQRFPGERYQSLDRKELFCCIKPVQNPTVDYGYAISTNGQNVDAKVKQLRVAGAEKVFRETASGARRDHAQLRRVLDQLDKGDVLTVTRLDRLARSTCDLLNTLAIITSKGAGFRARINPRPRGRRPRTR